MCGGESQEDKDIEVKNKEEAKKNETKVKDDFTKTLKGIDESIKKLSKGNKNDGKKEKIFSGVKGDALKTQTKLGYYTVTLSKDKGLKAKGSAVKKAKYQGQHQGKVKHGFGVRVSPDGSVYEGNWEKDVPSGAGRNIYADGSYFEGTFKGEDSYVKGKLVAKDGLVTEGDFKGKLPDGLCKVTDKDGAIQIGKFKDGKKEGEFSTLHKSELIEVQTFKKDKSEGVSKFHFKNGDIYEGETKKGEPMGKGKLTREKIVYEGEFKGLKMNGKFKAKTADGIEMEAEFKDDKNVAA